MNLSVPRDRLSHLADAVRIASTPFEYAQLDDWRAELLHACIGLLGGEMGHFDVFGLPLAHDSLFVGYSSSVYEEWWTTWATQDPALPFMETARLSVYTRRHRYRIAGDHWTATYKRSAIYHEFYRKHRLADATGLLLRSGDVTAHLHVETGTVADDDEDERARCLMSIVEPGVRATLRTLGRSDERRHDAFALLDALSEPVAVIGPTGQWLHRSPAFDDLLDVAPHPARLNLLAETEQHARRFLDALAGVRHDGLSQPQAAPLWTTDVFTISATAIELSRQSGTSCLVRLQPRSGVTLEQIAAAGLTKREGDVAILLAEGLPNKAIAERLGISEHTVRRHGESIFRKLGVASRASVASALRNGLDLDHGARARFE